MFPIVTYDCEHCHEWDDCIFSSKLNALYKIAPGSVTLRHSIREHKIGALNLGDKFIVEGISILDCLSIVDEFLYINADRRLNLLTGDVEAVSNPQHQKIESKLTGLDFLPMSAQGAPEEYKIIAKIDRNDGEYLLSVIEVNIGYNDLIKWLTDNKRKYRILDKVYYNQRVLWRLIVTRTHIAITYPVHDGKYTSYRIFHDFIVEFLFYCNKVSRIIVPCLKTGTIECCTMSDIDPDIIDVNVLNTYYFATARTYRDVACSNGLASYYNENGKLYYDGEDYDKYDEDDIFTPDVAVHAFDMLRYIKPKNIEIIQKPTQVGKAIIELGNVTIAEHLPDIFENIDCDILFSGEHFYKYTADCNRITITRIDNDTTYQHNISNIYTDDKMFYMRGDIIYTCRGYLNILTGVLTIAPNETIKPNKPNKPNKFEDMLNSFDFSVLPDGPKYIAGQYLVIYVEFYIGPIEIEGFRAVVNGNISVYEYAGVSKVKIPTRTKPALP